MVQIDDSYGEGGGQIVRTACSPAAVTKKPCRIINIRQGRRDPGLRLKHVLGLHALAKLCCGSLEGAEVGSGEVVFHPREIVARISIIPPGGKKKGLAPCASEPCLRRGRRSTALRHRIHRPVRCADDRFQAPLRLADPSPWPQTSGYGEVPFRPTDTGEPCKRFSHTIAAGSRKLRPLKYTRAVQFLL
ncbi:MAG: RNA 3'-terminal phosphate cyclase, partial [Bdellovibrionota bacterium]